MVCNGKQHNQAHGMVGATGFFVEYKCYATSGEVVKIVK